MIYLPMKNANHRVWRITAGESVALSTYERVPIIVCLEVIDFDKMKVSKEKEDFAHSVKFKSGDGRRSNRRNDRWILENWCYEMKSNIHPELEPKIWT